VAVKGVAAHVSLSPSPPVTACVVPSIRFTRDQTAEPTLRNVNEEGMLRAASTGMAEWRTAGVASDGGCRSRRRKVSKPKRQGRKGIEGLCWRRIWTGAPGIKRWQPELYEGNCATTCNQPEEPNVPPSVE